MAGRCVPAGATDPWSFARDRYMEDLNEEEKRVFANASLENLFYSASAAQKEHEQKSKSRAISARLEPFVTAIDQYATALDIYSNTYSIATSPLWGSIRVLLHIAKAFEKYFEKLVSMFTRIGDILPRCRVYQSLFPSHERLLQAISVAYLDIIHFCMGAKATFRKLKKSTTLHLTSKMIWKDFDKEFDETLNNFRNHAKSVEKEAVLSNMIEASDERSLMRADRVEMERQRKIGKRNMLMSQLSSIRYIDKHLKERKKRHGGTGTWVNQTKQFEDWMTRDRSDCLWCYGIPGSGKTVLASSLIDAMAGNIYGNDITMGFTSEHIIDRGITSHEAAITYYYCDFSNSKSLETCNILGAIAKQLLEKIVIPDDVEERIDSSCMLGARTPTDGELVAILASIFKQFSKVFIFIDGLDECGKEEQSTISSMVHQLSQSHSPIVKILITSREESAISASLKGFPRLQISPEKISHDIGSFVKETVKSNIESGALIIQDPSLESDIISALVDGAQGMFLWVHFQLADLCEAATDLGIRETLRNLPEGMAATYARILQKIGRSRTDIGLAQRIFKWIVCAKRPLRLAELGEAVAFKPTDSSWDANKVPNSSRLLQACRNLAVLNEEDETVRLAHHTVQQFLLQQATKDSIPGFHFQLPQADIEAGEICIAYLSFSDFETQITRSYPGTILPVSILPSPAAILDRSTSTLGLGGVTASIFRLGQYIRMGSTRHQLPNLDLGKFAQLKRPPSPDLREKYRLLDYAVKNWVGHTSKFSEYNTTMWEEFRHLAMDKPMPFDVRIWGNPVSGDFPYMALFRWAIDAGHLSLLRLLQLPTGSNLHSYCRQNSEEGRSVVLSASRRGQVDLIEFLANQACVDDQDGMALIEAAENGHDSVVQLLLKHRLCLEGRSEALQIAARSGHATVLRLLLENEPSLDLQHGWGKVALVEAAEKGLDEVLAVLVAKASTFESAILELEKIWGGSALHMAAGRGYGAVVRLLLLEAKVDVNSENNFGETALHWAARDGHKVTVQLLLEANADVDAKANGGWTALHRAAGGGHGAAVQLLLKAKAGVDAKDNHGRAALCWAARYGHEAVVQQLLKAKADVNAGDKDRWTALRWAACNGHEAVVQQLLQAKADVNAGDKDGWIALYWAARNGHKAVVYLLLQAKADVDSKNNNERTALHWAASEGAEGALRLLLETKADVNAKDKYGNSALYCAARNGHEVVVQLLSQAKADISVKDNDGWTALYWAARNGHKAVVQLLLQAKVDVDAKNNDGWTVLYWAARNGHKAVVQLLLQAKANVDARDNDGRTALYWAARNGHKAVVQLLLQAKADVNTRDNDGRTALYWAAWNRHEAVVQLLLQAKADVDTKDNDGWAAMYRAAKSGHEAVVQLLLQAKANVDAKDNDGRTALYWAAKNRHKAVVQLLLQAKADIDARDNDGWTAMYRAARNGHEAVVQLLLQAKADIDAKDNDGWTALYWAARNGHKAVVQLLLHAKADVEAKDNDGRTTLYWAARNGHKAVVQLLLQAKADVDVKDNDGWTALYWAARNGHTAVVQLLLQTKADVDARDNDGRTALYWAAWSGHEAVAQLLLQAKADVDARDNDGWTALYWAAWNGHEVVVQLLLQANANVDARGWAAIYPAARTRYEALVQMVLQAKIDVDERGNGGGWTALYWAARNGHKAVVQLLLQAKADVNTRDNDGRTALYWAAWNRHEAVVQLLLQAKADVDAKDNDGRTALYWAAWNGHEVVVQLLLQAKADVDVKDNYGRTALCLAARNRYKAVVQLLLQARADVGAKDNDGWTAMYWAARNGHKAVV